MLKRHLPAFAGLYLIFAFSTSLAQSEQLSQGMSDFEAASSEILALLQTIDDPESAAATAPQLMAATERRDQAEDAIEAAVQGMDPNDPEQGHQIEQVYEEIQSANQAVAEAQLQALERQADAEAAAE